MIGVTYKKRPILGVIGQPYVQTSSTDYIYLPRILVGSSIMKEKCAFEYYGGDINYWSIIENTPKGDDLKRVAISSRRETEKQKKILSSFNSERVSCGGSGNKIAMVIRG